MLNESFINKLSLIIIALSIIINLIFYPFLPSSIMIHFNSSGNADNYIPKLMYIPFMAMLSIGIYALYRLIKQASAFANLGVSIVILGINIFSIYINVFH
ncbi:MAG: DUF1648 domain-containing protein [Clostridium sp.]|uniref:DUF1648 domain-containing protein n=1 Tax=Clostridium sp. TaxID=1506 RepID=UPI0039E84800